MENVRDPMIILADSKNPNRELSPKIDQNISSAT